MKRKNKKAGFFRSTFAEIRDTIFGELLVNLLLFVPRLLIRIIKHLF